MIKLIIDGASYDAETGARLIDIINQTGREIPQVCYHPQLGSIQTCDTCLVEVNGQLARACGTTVSAGMQIVTGSARVESARREAFDRILGNHLLYCTVCDNNNGNCTVHKQSLEPFTMEYPSPNKRRHHRLGKSIHPLIDSLRRARPNQYRAAFRRGNQCNGI